MTMSHSLSKYQSSSLRTQIKVEIVSIAFPQKTHFTCDLSTFECLLINNTDDAKIATLTNQFTETNDNVISTSRNQLPIQCQPQTPKTHF